MLYGVLLMFDVLLTSGLSPTVGKQRLTRCIKSDSFTCTPSSAKSRSETYVILVSSHRCARVVVSASRDAAPSIPLDRFQFPSAFVFEGLHTIVLFQTSRQHSTEEWCQDLPQHNGRGNGKALRTEVHLTWLALPTDKVGEAVVLH